MPMPPSRMLWISQRFWIRSPTCHSADMQFFLPFDSLHALCILRHPRTVGETAKPHPKQFLISELADRIRGTRISDQFSKADGLPILCLTRVAYSVPRGSPNRADSSKHFKASDSAP